MEFKKLSDVTLVEQTTADTNILIEENGEISKVSKSLVGAQADWNETDETNPAFIMNKPEALGGYTYYSYYGGHLYKSDGTYSTDTEEVTKEEFEAEYMKSPIMLICDNVSKNGFKSGSISPIVWYRMSDNNAPFIGHYGSYGKFTSYIISFPTV